MRCNTPLIFSIRKEVRINSIDIKHIYLTWNACENPMWCCCPCTWEIFRDGVKIDTSDGANFTDLDRPSGFSHGYFFLSISPYFISLCLCRKPKCLYSCYHRQERYTFAHYYHLCSVCRGGGAIPRPHKALHLYHT